MLVGTFKEAVEACAADAEHAGGKFVESVHQTGEVRRLAEKSWAPCLMPSMAASTE